MSPVPLNEFMVGVQAGEVVILIPPVYPMSTDRALALAAWLVAVTGGRERLNAVLDAVEGA